MIYRALPYFYRMHKPGVSLLFGALLFALMGVISFLMPEKGIQLSSGLVLSFPTLTSIFENAPPQKNTAEVLEAFNDIDTSFALIETFGENEEKIKKEPLKTLITELQYKDVTVMKKFYTALDGLKEDPKSIRVLHYGDSQIEGDRITDFIRLKFQEQFGGAGPGLISLMPLSSSIINKISNGPGWDRYNVFTAKDKRVKHSNYGVLASFNRYCGYFTM